MRYEEIIENKGLLNFLENVLKDKESIEKFFSCGSLSSMYEYALRNSNEKFSFEEFKSALHLLFQYAKDIKKIPECDEKNITGGGKNESKIMSLMMMAMPLINFAMSSYQYFNIYKELDKEITDSKKLRKYYEPERKSREETLKKEIALLEDKLKEKINKPKE